MKNLVFAAAALALMAVMGCGLSSHPQAGTDLVPLKKIPQEVLAQCPEFGTLIKACNPREDQWWVIYRTEQTARTPEGVKTVGVHLVGGQRWRKNIDANRLQDYCD